jgi:hypothetical protein
MNNSRNFYSAIFLLLLGSYACKLGSDHRNEVASFQSVFPPQNKRTWIGPEYWANRLQDWQVSNGRIECLVSDYDRNVYMLTRQFKSGDGDISMQVDVGFIAPEVMKERLGWAGFKIGIKGEFDDYRDNAVKGVGLHAGILTSGKLFIGEYGQAEIGTLSNAAQQNLTEKGVTIQLKASPAEAESYQLELSALDKEGKELEKITKKVSALGLEGGLALVSDFPRNLPEEGFESTLKISHGEYDQPSFWYTNWKISGSKVAKKPEQAFGPILFSQYTLSNGTMKMTAQMPPIGEQDAQEVKLQVKEGNSWKDAGTAGIHPMARTATFKVENWKDTEDVNYRLVYEWSNDGGEITPYYLEGVVKKDPKDKEDIVVVAFTGNNDLGFPDNEIVRNVLIHKPDLLFFSGDQIYESVGGFGHQMEPVDKATLDYLRKWYLYGWGFSEMLSNIPSVAIPDDHDVYHGNVWGEGGKAAKKEGTTKERQDSGGYKLPPDWVNMVQITQTSHLPDPYDPTPVKQDIGVYYTEMNLGGISFAIIEDRKWKSSPANIFPPEYQVLNGWPENPQYNQPKDFYAPEAELLGGRQMDFLDDWTKNWENAWMKVVLSQTIFSTVATLPDSAVSDVVVPTLRITKKGEYPPNDIPTQDMDSNGWPKQERDNTLRILRKAFAFHIAGDQHLGSTIHYGIDDWGDAGYSICVPSISNYFPRRWFPQESGKNRKTDMPRNTGDYEDGFGNKMTVMAVSNPYYTGLEPSKLYDRAAGYGIISFNRKSREITMANWPRQTDPSATDAKPYQGWPIKIRQEDNYGRKAVAYLPVVKIEGSPQPPVIQVIDESSKEVIYTIRAKGNTFKPKVFKSGSYTIKVGEPGTDKMKTISGVQTTKDGNREILVSL